MTTPRTAPHRAAGRARTTTTRRPANRPSASGRTGGRSSAGRPVVGRKRTSRRVANRRSSAVGTLRSWWPTLLIACALLAALTWRPSVVLDTAPNSSCTLPSGITLTTEQMANAATIAEVGRARGLPERAIVIALATAMQESTLRNLDYGDRDSLGLFQQRPSQGWGTPQQVQDPVYAAGIFYDRLVQVPDWQSLRVTDASQRVQRSAYPELYEKWAGMAQQLSTALATDSPSCS